MRPTVLLVLGVRGIPFAHLSRSLSGWADIVVAATSHTLARRPDGADVARHAPAMIVADGPTDLVTTTRQAGQRLDGVFTTSDDAIMTTALIAAELGLPGQPPQTMPGFCDKVEQRRRLRRGGVAVPAFAEFDGSCGDALQRVLADVPLPAVLKPTQASGAALTYLCHTPEQVRAALGAAAAHRAAASAVAPDSAYVLESMLVGIERRNAPGLAPYVSVETLAEAGAYHHLAVTDRFPTAPPTLETGMLLPSCLGAEEQDAVRDCASAGLRALEFVHGVAHTEVMLTADGPRIIEVNARVGGALPYLFPMVSDVDIVEQAARLAVGLPVTREAHFGGHAAFISPQHPVGAIVEAVDGLADVAALSGVRAVLPVEVGRAGPTPIGFDNTMIAAVLATVPDAAAAMGLWHDVMDRVRPRYLPPGAVASPPVVPTPAAAVS